MKLILLNTARTYGDNNTVLHVQTSHASLHMYMEADESDNYLTNHWIGDT